MNIAEFSGIPKIHSLDSDPTAGAGDPDECLDSTSSRLDTKRTFAPRKHQRFQNAVARIAEPGSCVATSEIRRTNRQH